jgi:tRNA (guanine10-N2)-methyltransferase
MMATSNSNERYLVLVEFAYIHLDFQLAELESILDMYGIQLGGPECSVFPLPGEEQEISSDKPGKRRPYVILSFPCKDAARLLANRNQEKWVLATRVDKNSGIVEILSRCALVKSIIELWGSASSIDKCASATEKWVRATDIGKSIFDTVSAASQSWKLTVHTLGTKYSREEQEVMRKKFSYLGFEGPVRMEEPDNEYILIREVEMDGKCSPLHPPHCVDEKLIPENDRLPPLGVYFGRILGGTSKKGRGGLEQYNLKHRVYLGPTSMDAELSFVMTSFGQVQKGSVVFDPFVGTGSILLSCALRGAYCMGSDIDIRILKGRSDKENIWKNFDQFNLNRPEIVRTDNAIYHRHFRSHRSLYDAIVCDPPYGIRAGARKTGSRLENPRPILDEHRHDHIAQTKPYPVSDVMSDLLDVAARTLVMNGRLVYVIPSFKEFNPDTDLPRHDCLRLVHACYQPLSADLGRRIVAMEKVQDYDESLREKYVSSIWINGKESAEKCANLRDKILEAAKKKPGYEAKAAVRREKRKAHKKEKKEARKRAKTEVES